jgi:hypothetical protein
MFRLKSGGRRTPLALRNLTFAFKAVSIGFFATFLIAGEEHAAMGWGVIVFGTIAAGGYPRRLPASP